jgi:ElaB/YqjD/DUF883 family membrane-anchored ribosome-binding protein
MASRTGVPDAESASTADRITDPAQDVKERISDTAATAKEKASEVGRQATEQADARRGPAADALQNAAATVHEKAEALPGGETVKGVAHSAADKLESTAGYIREHDVTAMVSDVEGIVRRNPGPSLLIAAAIGFLIGRAFREDY